jgi:autophagy-related protein 5
VTSSPAKSTVRYCRVFQTEIYSTGGKPQYDTSWKKKFPSLTKMVTDDYNAFAKVNNRLLNPSTALKSVPLRIYVPSTPNNDSASAEYKVMQTLMPPKTSNRE